MQAKSAKDSRTYPQLQWQVPEQLPLTLTDSTSGGVGVPLPASGGKPAGVEWQTRQPPRTAGASTGGVGADRRRPQTSAGPSGRQPTAARNQQAWSETGDAPGHAVRQAGSGNKQGSKLEWELPAKAVKAGQKAAGQLISSGQKSRISTDNTSPQVLGSLRPSARRESLTTSPPVKDVKW